MIAPPSPKEEEEEEAGRRKRQVLGGWCFGLHRLRCRQVVGLGSKDECH